MIRIILGYILVAVLFGFWPFDSSIVRSTDWSPLAATYDEGYEDGYNGTEPRAKSTQYLTGYDDGDFDAHCEWVKYKKKDRERFYSDRCGDWDRY